MKYLLAVTMCVSFFSAFPALAETELEGVVNNFRSNVQEQSQRGDYTGYARPLATGKQPYTITYQEHKPAPSASQWNHPSNYQYNFNAVSPQTDGITPQRAWGE